MMTLRRKARTVGDSLTVSIPSQLADLHDINEGSLLEFQPMTKGTFKLVKMAKLCTIRKKGTKETKNILPKEGKCVPPEGWVLA